MISPTLGVRERSLWNSAKGLERVIGAPVPGSFSDQAPHLFILGCDEAAIRACGVELARDGNRQFEGFACDGDALRVQVLVPPPTAIVLEVEPTDFELEARTRYGFGEEPHLAALDEGLGSALPRSGEEIFLHPDPGLREEGELRSRRIEELGLRMLLQEAPRFASRWLVACNQPNPVDASSYCSVADMG